MTDTNNTDGAALLPVTQSDREAFAALDICGGWYRNMKADKIAEFAREGMIDDNELIQAFARHRLATQEDAVTIPVDHPLAQSLRTSQKNTRRDRAARTGEYRWLYGFEGFSCRQRGHTGGRRAFWGHFARPKHHERCPRSTFRQHSADRMG